MSRSGNMNLWSAHQKANEPAEYKEIGQMQRHLSLIFRYWFPFALFLFFLVPVIMGEIGHAFGLPHLFRDDPQLREGGFFWLRNRAEAV